MEQSNVGQVKANGMGAKDNHSHVHGFCFDNTVAKGAKCLITEEGVAAVQGVERCKLLGSLNPRLPCVYPCIQDLKDYFKGLKAQAKEEAKRHGKQRQSLFTSVAKTNKSSDVFLCTNPFQVDRESLLTQLDRMRTHAHSVAQVPGATGADVQQVDEADEMAFVTTSTSLSTCTAESFDCELDNMKHKKATSQRQLQQQECAFRVMREEEAAHAQPVKAMSDFFPPLQKKQLDPARRDLRNPLKAEDPLFVNFGSPYQSPRRKYPEDAASSARPRDAASMERIARSDDGSVCAVLSNPALQGVSAAQVSALKEHLEWVKCVKDNGPLNEQIRRLLATDPQKVDGQRLNDMLKGIQGDSLLCREQMLHSMHAEIASRGVRLPVTLPELVHPQPRRRPAREAGMEKDLRKRPEDRHASPRPEDRHASPRPEDRHASPRPEDRHIARRGSRCPPPL